jgi:hypothetical protein
VDVKTIFTKIGDSALIIIGLAALCTAALLFNLEIGLVGIGLSLLILDVQLSS